MSNSQDTREFQAKLDSAIVLRDRILELIEEFQRNTKLLVESVEVSQIDITIPGRHGKPPFKTNVTLTVKVV